MVQAGSITPPLSQKKQGAVSSIGNKSLLPKPQESDTFKTRGNEMAVKVKPVQPTEIKDKKIAREVIEQIRKPIPASVYKRHEKLKQTIEKMTRK
jgi:hypothetical protein